MDYTFKKARPSLTLRGHVLPLCLAVALLVIPAQAQAQTLSAEDLMNMPLEKLADIEVLVTGASKYAEKASDSPAIIEVITAEDIRHYGYRTLGDAINGLHGIYSSSDRNYNSLGARGFIMTGYSSSRILIMIDGRRMNENVYDAAYVGEEFMLDMSLIDHIEFIPGPGSSIYGANAMMGVVNVVTKKGSDINGTQVEAGIGSFNTQIARTTFGKKLDNGADVLLSASGYQSGGQEDLYYPGFDSPATNNGIAHDLDDEYSKRLYAKVEKDNFTYVAGYQSRYKKVPTAPYVTEFNVQGNDTLDTQMYGEIRFNKSLNDKSNLELKSYVQGYDSKLQYPYSFFGPYILTTSYAGRWAGVEATYVTQAFDKQKIVIGMEAQYDFSQKLYDYDLFGIYQNTDRHGLRSGIFIQDNYQLLDSLILSAGLRLDQHHLIDNLQINPRLGLIWNPVSSTTFKLLYGSAFRAPNVYERDYDAYTSWTANPNNEEEHIKNYEAAIEWRGPDNIKLSSSLFYNSFTDVLNRNYDSLSPDYHKYLNTGNLKSAGIELGAEKKWDNGREARLSYNHTEYLKHEGTAWGAVDAPKDVAKVRYIEPLFDDKVKLAIEDIFVGHRKTLYYLTADHYNIINVNISGQDVLLGMDMSLGIYNALNNNRDMIGSAFVDQNIIPMNGRSLMFIVQKTF